MTLRVVTPVEQYWHRVPGGTARATRETLRALADGGAISIAPVAAWHRPSRRRTADEPRAGLEPVRYLPAPRPLLYEAWIRWNRPAVERWVGPVDVTWAVSMIPVPSTAPMVATVHDLGFLHHPERNSRRGRSFFPRAWAAMGERAALIVCPSQTVADDCARYGIDRRRLRVVPWGVGRPQGEPSEADAIRHSFGLPERFVLWVGTLEPRKNLPRLVAAIAELDGPPLAVVGPSGWNIDGQDVLAPLGRRALRLGRVDDRQLSGLYRSASVLALPSLEEGFGLPVLEAMAHGTPVVTSAGTATEEVAAGAAELVDPTDVASIVAGLETALRRDASTMRRIERGLQRARHLSWAEAANGYAAVFAEAAGGP